MSISEGRSAAAAAATMSGATSVDSLLDSVLEKFRLKPAQQALLIRQGTLLLIWVLAFAVRLVSACKHKDTLPVRQPAFSWALRDELLKKTAPFILLHEFVMFPVSWRLPCCT